MSSLFCADAQIWDPLSDCQYKVAVEEAKKCHEDCSNLIDLISTEKRYSIHPLRWVYYTYAQNCTAKCEDESEASYISCENIFNQ